MWWVAATASPSISLLLPTHFRGRGGVGGSRSCTPQLETQPGSTLPPPPPAVRCCGRGFAAGVITPSLSAMTADGAPVLSSCLYRMRSPLQCARGAHRRRRLLLSNNSAFWVPRQKPRQFLALHPRHTFRDFRQRASQCAKKHECAYPSHYLLSGGTHS
jgi:hypothetical protein